MNPSMPGLESPFMELKWLNVISFVVRSPSIFLDWSSVSFLLVNSIRGSVSMSELRKSCSAFGDRSRFVCSLYICLKVSCSSE